jgi:hypothetical protein
MNPDEKWEHEREVAVRFLELQAEHEPTLSRPAGAHPDVIWQSQRGAIGLEVTRLVAHQVLTTLEIRREDVLRRVRQLAIGIDAEHLDVVVHWHDEAPAPGASHQGLAEELFKVVRAHLPAPGATVALGTGFGFDLEFVHPTFDRLRIDRSQPHGGVFFSTMYSVFPSNLSAAYLRGRVNSKSRRRRDAMPAVSEHWLIIYGSHGPLSSYMDPEPSALAETYASMFDRIFLVFLNEGRWWELATTGSASP